MDDAFALNTAAARFSATSSGNLHDACVFGTYPDDFKSTAETGIHVHISLFLSVGLPIGLIIYKPRYLSTIFEPRSFYKEMASPVVINATAKHTASVRKYPIFLCLKLLFV